MKTPDEWIAELTEGRLADDFDEDEIPKLRELIVAIQADAVLTPLREVLPGSEEAADPLAPPPGG